MPELGNTLGKSIRNFKDAISGVEEAKFRRLEEEKQEQQRLQAQAQAQEAKVAATPPPGEDPSKKDPNNSGTA